jgi:cysteine desulfurase
MIYLDHAATTPVHPRVREAMLPFLDGEYGNPSGLYEIGRRAQAAVDDARRRVAACLGARSPEILFTSGGTESINSAMLGIAYAMRRAGAGNHVITSQIEHHAGLHAAQFLEEQGFDVTYAGCDSHGRMDLAELEAALRPDTVLVSVMLANNEVGTVEPIREMSGLVKGYARARGQSILLHTDAVQAPGWLALNVDELGVDALSLSSHKFGGPKGAGVLYLRRATPFRQLLHGGGQESQKRAGTENVPGIVGTAAALELASTGIAERSARVLALRTALRDSILAAVPDAVVNGCQENCLPNNLNISFSRIESEQLVAALDARGIAASSGSACSNSTWEPSHVLMAMGVPIRRAVGSVRFSLGENTTAAEVETAARVVAEELGALRATRSAAL